MFVASTLYSESAPTMKSTSSTKAAITRPALKLLQQIKPCPAGKGWLCGAVSMIWFDLIECIYAWNARLGLFWWYQRCSWSMWLNKAAKWKKMHSITAIQFKPPFNRFRDTIFDIWQQSSDGHSKRMIFELLGGGAVCAVQSSLTHTIPVACAPYTVYHVDRVKRNTRFSRV